MISSLAGSPLNAHARLPAERLGQVLGQPVIIDYDAGAGDTVGAEFVTPAAPDDYTLLMVNTGTMVINPAVHMKLSHNRLKDFAPITRAAQPPLVLHVNPEVPGKSAQELVALAKTSPGKLSHGSAGSSGISHLVPEMLKTATRTYLGHIPSRDSPPASTDLLGGQLQMLAESIPQAAHFVKRGKLRALAMTGRERNAALSDLPTFAEAGIKGMDIVGLYGVGGPAGTTKDAVVELSEAFRQTLETPDLRKLIVDQGACPAYGLADQLSAYLMAQMPVVAKAVTDSGTKLN